MHPHLNSLTVSTLVLNRLLYLCACVRACVCVCGNTKIIAKIVRKLVGIGRHDVARDRARERQIMSADRDRRP